MRCEHADVLDVVEGAVAGVVAGVAGAYAMKLFQRCWSRGVDGNRDGLDLPHPGQSGGERRARHQAQQQFTQPATVQAATAVSHRVFHHDLAPAEKRYAGPAMHYAMGASVGALYGALAEIAPVSTTGFGMAYGAGVWLVADQGVVPALRLAPPPTRESLADHTYSVASHLVFGITAELVRRIFRSR